MTTRRPLLPLAPLSNNNNKRYAHITTTKSDVVMEEREDTQDLSSLENDADDDFERLMIQNARDERRLKDALHGSRRASAFSKARTHPRVGLTLDNLERNNTRNDAAFGANAPVKVESPPSSSGSVRSDPAIHAPPGWGRKSRSNRNWMRTITYEGPLQTPPPAEDTINGLYDDSYEQQAGDNNHPRRSIEDSPLSHKSTPRNDRSAEWDLTFELNEASIIASTPYIPRNTMLDDIRQREMEALKLDRIPEGPPDEARRPLQSSTASGTTIQDQAMRPPASPEKRLRNRTNSWQSIGKSQPVMGTGKENSPVTVYKTSTETMSVVERDVSTDTRKSSSRPKRHRREDSQDLLRRLARASNTPSPGRVPVSRPQTAPARQLSNSLPNMATDAIAHSNEESADAEIVSKPAVESPAPAPEAQTQQEEPHERNDEVSKEIPQAPEAPPEPAAETGAEDVDATPMPLERSILNPKTPVVTGAWVDTPGPRTTRKHISIARSPSQSPKKSSTQKNRSPEGSTAPTVNEVVEDAAVDVIRPQLPGSALQALVQEAKAHDRRQSADYGDSTINSLEDLISSPLEREGDEDTLQGLQIPTVVPRNEAERQRQQELLHLHRMNDRLRAARTSIRDASRGMKRVEDRVEHGEEIEGGDRVILRECPCAADQSHRLSAWNRSKNLFWDAKLKTKRKGTKWRMMSGLTLLSIFMLVFMIWWISEEIACELYCHHPYANYSPYSFSVNPNAPRYPFVIPTLVYRNLMWWLPFSWMGTGMLGTINSAGLHQSATSTAAWATQSQVIDEVVWDQSMLHDEVVR